jgi:hypothetical protein
MFIDISGFTTIMQTVMKDGQERTELLFRKAKIRYNENNLAEVKKK